MKDSKKVTIGGQKVEITKIPIRRTAELMFVINKVLPKVMEFFSEEELENLTNETFLQKLPILIANVQDDLFDFVSVASGIDKEVIENCDFEEFIDVVTVILELNNFKAIIEKVKNLGGILQIQMKK